MIVDAHCHTSDRWYEPADVVLWQMDRLGIDIGILTQYSGQFDNGYQTEWARRHPDRFASVVVVDSADPSAPDKLSELVADGAAGVRFRAGVRAPGEDPLAVWRRAAELGIPASVLGSEQDFTSEAFASLLTELPELSVIVEHLGTGGETGLAYTEQAAAEVFALARFPQVSMKFHGLAEFTPRTPDRTSDVVFVEPIRPLLWMALDAFGPERLMWGSDYPPVSSREGYELSLELPRRAFAAHGVSDDVLASIFGGAAARLHGLVTVEAA